MKPRTPPISVSEQLRREVNFGCPVRYADGEGCGSPILTYHHFDPPWSASPDGMHDPQGMIALCPQHHAQADGGHWTKQQLREMKRNPWVNDWVRARWPYDTPSMLVKVGPSLVFGSGSPVRLNGRQAFGFAREYAASLNRSVVIIDSDIRDNDDRDWLRIKRQSLEAYAGSTSDLRFQPHLRCFEAKTRSGMWIRLRAKFIPYRRVADWLRSFLYLPTTKREQSRLDALVESGCRHIQEMGLIDTDGRVPIFEFECQLETSIVKLLVRRDRMCFTCKHGAFREEFDWHTHFVGGGSRQLLRWGETKEEFFSLG